MYQNSQNHQKALGLPLSTLNFWTLFWTPIVWKGQKSHFFKILAFEGNFQNIWSIFHFFLNQTMFEIRKGNDIFVFSLTFLPQNEAKNLKCPSDIQISGSLKYPYLLCKRANGVVECRFRISTSERSKKFSAFFLVSIFCKKL